MTFCCHYCGAAAELVGGKVIYPHRPDLYAKKFWRCAPCEAYVGCHPGTENPLGIVAKAALRTLKSRVHAAFDPRWRSGQMSRNDAYQWLADGLRMNRKDCHVGWFNEERCQSALSFLATKPDEGA